MLADEVTGISEPEISIQNNSGITAITEKLESGQLRSLHNHPPGNPRLKALHISDRGNAPGYKSPSISPRL